MTAVPGSTPTAVPLIDLHTHSTVSDGLLTPGELAHEAARRGLSVLALTDHDTVDGLDACAGACARLDIMFIPGIELSTDVGRHEVHVLGYFVDSQSELLREALAALTSARYARTDRIVRRLAEIGLPVEMERVRELAGPGTIGRPHVARAMIERGYVSSVSEAFDRFLGSGQPGFVPRAPNSPEDAVRLVRASGGVPVLAHPFTTGDIEHILRRLVPVGLAGMEVHYGEYDRDQRATLAAIAEHWSLIPTGGSDFHGPGFKSGRELGSVAVPLESVTRLKAAAETP